MYESFWEVLVIPEGLGRAGVHGTWKIENTVYNPFLCYRIFQICSVVLKFIVI